MFCDEHGTQDYCGECIAESLEARIKELEAKYNELLYAVETKQPNMTRHETALHYIQSRERGCQLGQAINTQERDEQIRNDPALAHEPSEADEWRDFDEHC